MYNRLVIIKKTILIFIFFIICSVLFAETIDIAAVRAEEEFRWGVIAYNSGFFNKAILSFEKSLSIKKSNLLTRTWLGRAYYRSGYVEQALNIWKDILKNGPGNSLLQQKVENIIYRRGLGKELTPEDVRYVISNKIDAAQCGYYPFKKPGGVYSDKKGIQYVTCFGSNEILKIDVNNKIIGILRGGVEGYDHPFDVVKSGNILYVTEYEGNRIAKCKLNGEKIKTFGKTGTGDGELLGPEYITLDNKGYLYVSDWGNGRVNKYDLGGQFILSFSSGLSGPTGVAVNGNEIFVADSINRDISVFDLSGNLLKKFGKGYLTDPEGLFTLNADEMLINDGKRVLKYNLSRETFSVLGDTESYASKLSGISVNPNGDIFVSDFNGDKVFVLTDMSSLYNSFSVNIYRVNARNFPNITMDISVAQKDGKPVIGLTQDNFYIKESDRKVDDLFLLKTNTDEQPISVALLIEGSKAMASLTGSLEKAVQNIFSGLGQKGKMEIISAGREPSIETKMGTTRLKLLEAAKNIKGANDWSFDRALRIAAADLIPREGRKSIVYIGKGLLNHLSFKSYSLIQLADYLKNNSIDFYTVSLENIRPADELVFLTEQTGGRGYFLNSPEGITRIANDIEGKIMPIYTLSFISHSESDFGRKYIKLSSEITVQKKSGRDDSGYYAPLRF